MLHHLVLKKTLREIDHIALRRQKHPTPARRGTLRSVPAEIVTEGFKPFDH